MAKSTPGKEAVAIEAFARALRQIPTIIADNAGYDSSELVSQLRASHYKGEKRMGLNMEKGIIGDMAVGHSLSPTSYTLLHFSSSLRMCTSLRRSSVRHFSLCALSLFLTSNAHPAPSPLT